MSTQNTLVLGTPTVDFDPSALQLMLNRAKTADDLKVAKDYILSYFAEQINQLLPGCGVPVIIPLNYLRIFRVKVTISIKIK